jgi:general secretion pathway protein I
MRRHSNGFSLLEILVAFVILALALGVLMRVFSGSLNNAAFSERYATAILVAESRLAALGVESPLVAGEAHGEAAGGYQWHSLIEQDASDVGVVDVDSRLGLYRVEVTVTWRQGMDRTRQVRLVGLRTGTVE